MTIQELKAKYLFRMIDADNNGKKSFCYAIWEEHKTWHSKGEATVGLWVLNYKDHPSGFLINNVFVGRDGEYVFNRVGTSLTGLRSYIPNFYEHNNCIRHVFEDDEEYINSISESI